MLKLSFSRTALFIVLTALLVAALAAFWKFGIEEWADPYLAGQHTTDSLAERWEFVIAATLFAALAMLPPLIFARRSINQGLHASRIASEVFRRAPQGIFVIDVAQTVVAANPAFELLTGLRAEDVCGRPLNTIGWADLPPETGARIIAALGSRGEWRGELVNARPDGGSYAVSLSMTAVRDEKGVMTEAIGVLTDITWRKLREDEARFEAMHDALTGLPNRPHFDEQLRLAISVAAVTGEHFALLFIDLDGFKRVNDTYGHAAGDDLLREVTLRLAGIARSADLLARLGGDEFVLIMRAIPGPEAAMALAERGIAALATPFCLGEERVVIGASIGIAVYPAHAVTPPALIAAADVAMYLAKARGRNRAVLFDATATPGGVAAVGSPPPDVP